MLTRKEAAELLQVSESTVYRLFKTRQLGGYLIGSQIRFDERDIEEYMARSRREPLPPETGAHRPQPETDKQALVPVPQKKRGRGRPRKGIEEISEYYPGMKVV